MKRGRFIVLEGGEGAGKSTWAAFIEDWLRRQGRRVLRTREPGGTPLAENIRGLLLGGREAMPPLTEALLMFAARDSHLRERIAPALASGQDVVCDRFVDSSYAYQGAGRGLPARTLDALARLTLGTLKPDLILVFDLPPEIGLARAKQRGDSNRFEHEALAFQRRVRRAFLARTRRAPSRYAVLDASRSLSEVRAQLLRVLEQRL